MVFSFLSGRIINSWNDDNYYAGLDNFEQVQVGGRSVWSDQRNASSVRAMLEREALNTNLGWARQAVQYVRSTLGIRAENDPDENQRPAKGSVVTVVKEWTQKHDEYVENQLKPLQEQLPVAEEALDLKQKERTKLNEELSKLKTSPSQSQLQSVRTLTQEIIKLSDEVRSIKQKKDRIIDDKATIIDFKAAATEKYRAGNCEEQAAVAFVYLRNLGVRPLDLVYAKDPKDHQYVVIGRTVDTDDPKDFGPLAVICDPWDRKAYPAVQFWSQMCDLGRGKSVIELELA